MTTKNTELINSFLSRVDIKKIILSLFNEMIEQKERSIYKSEYSLGKCIGNKADERIIYWLNKLTDFTYKKGIERSEPDCVCQEDKTLNFELKTASHNKLPGTKTHATSSRNGSKYTNNDEKIYIFVHYDIETLIPQHIYIGTLSPIHWKCSNSTGSGSAWITNDIFDEQFIRIY